MARIILITDHKWRDLPGNTLLKLALEQQYGHEVHLCRLGEERLIAPRLKPHMVIYNNLYTPFVNRYARYLHENGVKILILPTEGITFSDQQTELFTHKASGIQFIDGYLAWNDLLANTIVDNGSLTSDQVMNTGCCRFDFYRPELAGLRKTRHDYFLEDGIPENHKNILVISNFANAEFWPDASHLENEMRRQKAIGLPVFSDPEKLAKTESDYRKLFFAAIENICRNAESANILIKYHPSEKTSVYREFAERLKTINKNVYLIEGEYIWDLLNISDVVVQRSSTVAVEAWHMGIETVELDLLDTSNHFLRPIYKTGSHCVSTPEQAGDLVKSILSATTTTDTQMESERQAFLRRLSTRGEGLATERVAEAINGFLLTLGQRKKIRYENTKERIRALLLHLLGSKRYVALSNLLKGSFSDYLGRYDKQFDADDVRYWEKKIMAESPFSNPLSTKANTQE